MICSRDILKAAICLALVNLSHLVANADTWGDQVSIGTGKPTLIKMATTYTPCYLSRDENGNAAFGRFRFGEKLERVHRNRVSAVDGAQQSFIVQYDMDDKEYRHFRVAKLFFDHERQRLYMIVAVQTFPFESSARDRMVTVKGIIDDCKKGYGLSLIRNVVSDDRIVYEGSDATLLITLEVRKQQDSSRQLIFSVANKKVRSGEGLSFRSSGMHDIDDFVDVQL